MSISVTEYAVRVKGTQKYLVRSQRRDGRGGSHLEPVDFSLPPGQRLNKKSKRYEGEMQIRSYATRAAAENLLRSWCKGKFLCSRYGFDQDYEEETYIKSGTQRDPNMLEIVELTITLPA